MDQVIDFFSRLFGTESWPARWFCGTWTPFHGWLYILSDIAIWAAYFTIPVFLGMFIVRRRDLPFHGVFWLFVVFILACGSTHLFDALAFWWPAYRLNGLLRLITAVVSWTTVVALYYIIPHALSLRSPRELECEVQQRKKAEEQLRLKNRQLADAQALAHVGSWEWEITTDRVTWSDELYRIFGMQPQERSLNYDEVKKRHHPEDAARLHEAVEHSLRTGEPYQMYLRVLRADGDDRIVHARGEVMCDDNGVPVRLVGTTQDVTTIRKAEEALERKARELERSNAELEQFAFVASHDLQEPLRKIRTYGDRLSTKYAADLGEDAREKLDVIIRASERMQTLIEDLLQYSRLSTVQDPFREESLRAIVEEVLGDLQVSIERRQAAVSVGDLPTAVVAAGQIRQLFQNLIGNALKFQQEEHPPVVTVASQTVPAAAVEAERGAPTAAWYYRLSVRDNGIGFDESYREKIFAPFQRLHGRERYQGTGIGLAICKKVAENHGGYITAYSTPGAGAEFVVFLPAGVPPEGSTARL